ncbi:MAG: CinA family protein [Acholeplasmatales bacterium]|jgi:nicotinamide-nucleotide amidase|nr:CinA family protein [Acholeplasmatales bacterium]
MNDKLLSLIDFLKTHNLTITCAESCTGGLFASTLVSVSGVSTVFSESFVTYSDSSKMKYLKVPREVLLTYGAVSKETVYYMAKGLFEVTSANVTVCISGIAGPSGGTKEKPVGTVWFSYGLDEKIQTECVNFNPKFTRDKIRKLCVERAINQILKVLEESEIHF